MQFIAQGVGVHYKNLFAHVTPLFWGDVGQIYFVELAVEISVERFDFGIGIFRFEACGVV